jgi:hypothetical protein
MALRYQSLINMEKEKKASEKTKRERRYVGHLLSVPYGELASQASFNVLVDDNWLKFVIKKFWFDVPTADDNGISQGR